MLEKPQDSTVTLVVAMAENRCIGVENQMPWHISTDLKRFKTVTMGHPMIMGRKTYQSIGKPLPGRPNIVLTRDRGFNERFVQYAHSMKWALKLAAAHQTGKIMVIGGAEIFALAMPVADVLDVCHVHADVPGDTFFPEIDPAHWREVSRDYHDPEKSGGPTFSFVRYERRGQGA
ncbi:MAG: dihydrofolate reductase [Rhodospirillaceae bacterium]